MALASVTPPDTPALAVTRSMAELPVSLLSAAVMVGASVSVPAAVRVMVRANWLLLPARSLARTVKVLAPSANATPSNWKAPLTPASVSVPVSSRRTMASGSALPVRLTVAAVVW